METIKGTIKRVLFQNEDSGYKVLKASIPEGPLITLTGEFGPEIIPGTVADFHGDYKNHIKYGTNFKVTSYSISHNAEELLSIQMFIDTIAPNIGHERASFIVAHFGKDTINILDNNPERLQEVKGIGKVSAESLADAWKINREVWNEERKIYSLRAFLNSLGIKEKRVKKILGFFGGGLQAEELIRENPYILTEIEGFGFSTADFAARQLGIPENEPNRLRAYILYSLNVLCPSSGHLFFSPDEIVALINKYSAENNTSFLNKKIISSEDIEDLLEDLIKKNIVIRDMGVIYSRENHIFEHYSSLMISSIMKKQSDLISVDRNLIDQHIKNFERENNITLSEGQREALYFFAEKKVFVLTGGPGTGKCLGYDTPVLMFDGTIKKVQDIEKGDLLMGDDSKPRTVLSLNRGRELLYKVIPIKGDSYIVNKSHILSLKKEKMVIDIPVMDYLKLSKHEKSLLKGYKIIPTTIQTKLKNTETEIKLEQIGIGDYYGFEIDGNGRFLLGDFTVTHNTTLLKAIVELVNRLHLSLTCMTPTGIAAKKMATTIGHEAFTIHRRLGFRGKEWVYGEDNKFETDIVIVDETSMCDQETFYRLLSALKTRTHIILVGDHDQLPSVGAGNVLRDLINCGSIPVVRLEQIFRQTEASDIIKVAHKIKKGDSSLDLFKPNPDSDVFFLRENDLIKIEQYVVKLAQRFKDEGRKFQIISARNQGPLSVDSLNNSLQNILNPPGIEKECSMGSFILRRGDRIIFIKNDYELNVYNGEIGKIVNISSGFLTVQIDDRFIEISTDDALEKMKLAYTISAHRSQGNEYPYIILPFINQFGKNLLQRNLLYTAITRAKTKVIIIGHGSALERAINNSSVYKRNTKLGERINICFKT